MKVKINRSVLELVEGDLTLQDTDAIVSSANEKLEGGGGVGGAIHKTGGPQILEECRKIGGCPTGEARMTGGGRLKARYVIHAVGPVYRGGLQGEAATLASAYHASLVLASRHGLKSIAFPSISTGAFAYPLEAAAAIAVSAISAYLTGHTGIRRVLIVLFSPEAYRAYESALRELSGNKK